MYKKAGVWLSALALLGALAAYAATRDRLLTALETRQCKYEEEMREIKRDIKDDMQEMKEQLRDIYKLLIK